MTGQGDARSAAALIRLVGSVVAGVALVLGGIAEDNALLIALGGAALGIPGVTELVERAAAR